MPNNEKLTPEEKLNAAIESFEILKESLNNFSIREQLEMASSIRDNFSTDEDIIAACSESPTLSEKRKNLLDDIHDFQKELIKENTKKRKEESASKWQVNNFEKAKIAM